MGNSRSQRKSLAAILYVPMFTLFFVFAVPPTVCPAPVCKIGSVVKEWIGKYPVEGERNFLTIPEVRQQIEIMLGKKYMKRLTLLQREPYYLIQPINYLEGHLILYFVPNLHYSEDDEHILIIIRTKDCAAHVAFWADDLKARWKHTGPKEVPMTITTMYRLTRPD